MGFYSFKGVANDDLDQRHITSTGESYSLRHNEKLKVEMSFLGKDNSKSNSQGWERNNLKYFKTLYQKHPEMFSKKNVIRMKEGHAPIVDQKMISHNPNWAQFRNQELVHHHIGGNGEAVAVPQNVHKGQGEIHNHEKSAGITDKCKSFSQKCASRPDSLGKTTSQLHKMLRTEAKKNGEAVSGSTIESRHASKQLKSNGKMPDRCETVRNKLVSKQAVPQLPRNQSVRKVGKKPSVSLSSDRGTNVRQSIQRTTSGKVGKWASENNSKGRRALSSPPHVTSRGRS